MTLTYVSVQEEGVIKNMDKQLWRQVDNSLGRANSLRWAEDKTRSKACIQVHHGVPH
jgi:hypothetical protein